MKELDDAIAMLDKEITRLTAERELLRHARTHVKDILERLAPTIQSRSEIPSLIPEVVERNSPQWLGDDISIPDAAEAVLSEAGRALHVEAIHKKFKSRGKIVTKQSIVSGLLRKPERFRSLGRNTYGLIKWETHTREAAA